jgi:arabinose-5-phosphate isomerase
MNENLTFFKEALKKEAEAILFNIDKFGDEINQVITLLKNSTGKVIVCGLGKSGYVGRKIAATMASLGTPAIFIHACEALHGDLGAILSTDIILFISNSGETDEILSILKVVKTRGCSTICLCGKKESSLAKNVDIAIIYEYSRECDHLSLAPTVSSTLAIALGDAIAVTIAKSKNYTASDFVNNHLSGSLGKKLSNK